MSVAEPNPHAADTTLWPGRAPAPTDRLARGEMPPPASVTSASASAQQRIGNAPVTPNAPATTSEQHTFDRKSSPDPRQQTSGGTGKGRKPR